MRLGKRLGCIAILSGLSLLVGCGDEGDSASEASGTTGELSSAPEAVRIVNGRRFRLLGAVKNRAPYMNGAEEIGPSQPTGPRLEELTVEELAKGIRGRSLYAGYEYEEENVEDRAQLIYDHLHGRAKLPERTYNGSAPTVARAAAEDIEALTNKSVVGTDTRTVRENTTNPGARTVVLAPADATITSTTSSVCTASLIGRRTGLSAAHCFWDPVANTWRGDYAWAPGFDSQDAVIAPFGQTNRCYGVTIPNGFGTGSPIQFDYAVIDFSCNFPGDSAGWYARKTPGYTDAEINQSSSIWGYPGAAQSCGSSAVPCRTRVWGSSGTLAVGSPAYIINHSIDTTGGQSGSAVFRFFEGQHFQVGIHKGAGGSPNNWARRIDAAVSTAIVDWSTEF